MVWDILYIWKRRMGVICGKNGELDSFRNLLIAAYCSTPHYGVSCTSSISSIFPHKLPWIWRTPTAGDKSQCYKMSVGFSDSLNGTPNHEVIFKYDIDSLKSREWKMATGTQIVLEVKKNKLNNSSKWFTFGQKIRP